MPWWHPVPCLVLLHQLLLGSRKTRAGCAWTLVRAAGSQSCSCLLPSTLCMQTSRARKTRPAPEQEQGADGMGPVGSAQQSSHCPLSPALSPRWGLHLGVTSPPGQEHTQGLFPSTVEDKTPSCQTRTAPSLPASSHKPDFEWPLLLQTSQGWAFTRPWRESQPQPALHSSSSESCSCQTQAELPQPTRISPPSLAPGLAAPEVGLTSPGEQGETQQLCTCPQLMSDLFRRKSGLSGMKELEAAAWGWHKTA